MPCRNEATTIWRLLDAIDAQTRAPDRIVIVDDGSVDGTARVVDDWRRAHPRIPVDAVAGPRRGVAAAMNRGIEACPEAVIVRLDGHSVPNPDYIESALAALAEPGVGVVGGTWMIEPGSSTTVARAIASAVSHPLGSGGARYRHPSAKAGAAATQVETVPFGVFRRDLWTTLGGFDAALIANEDYDFNYRARRAGFAVVLDPRIASRYIARPTLVALGQQYHRYGFWKAHMLRKNVRALHWRQVPPALILPFVVAVAALACVSPGPLTIAAAGVYPALVAVGAVHIAARMNAMTAWPAAFAALAVVHLTWSAGFLRAILGLPAPGTAGPRADTLS